MSLNFGEENSIQAGHSLSVSIRSLTMKDALPQGEDVVLLSARVTEVITRLQQIPFKGWGFRKRLGREAMSTNKVITPGISLLIKIGSPLQTHFYLGNHVV